MNASRSVTIAAVLCFWGSVAHGQERARYREYELGNSLAAVAALAKVPVAGAKTVHQRPGLIQELEWRQPYVTNGLTTTQTDAVQRIVFSFYNDQLFRLVISYDRQRTNGLTDDDMIDAISERYGSVLLRSSSPSPSALALPLGRDLDLPIARWEGADYAVGLYRSSFVSEFRVVVMSPRLEALVQAASAEAIRLDAREAPQREVDRKNKEAEDARASQQKARIANRATFKP